MTGHAAWLKHLHGRISPALLAALQRVDRRAFLPPEHLVQADLDQALPIAAGQTISQPSLVAQMLEALQIEAGMCVLDLGAGSGYVSALLAELVGPSGRVIAVERQGDLVQRARPLLAAWPQIDLRHHDGLNGARDAAPFAAIHVGCACPALPRALTDQLGDHGRIVLPIGPLSGDQELLVVTRMGSRLHQAPLGPVRFVPALPGTVAPVEH